MTTQETFKKRIRTRMEKTGEKYGAARRVLIDQSSNGGPRKWAAQPEHSDEVILVRTGRSWDEWCDLIEAWPRHIEGHTAIATYIIEDLGIEGWWGQAVTVGYERIVGLRAENQMSDGTFTANKSKTVFVDRGMLDATLRDGADRAHLFPGIDTELRSRPTSKDVRLKMNDGTALIHFEPKADGRTAITVAHEKLESADQVAFWKDYRAEWLAAVDES